VNALDAPPLADAPDRERIRADLDRTLLVEAGAGTGKTTALVSRVVALVADGRLVMERLAAITFTEAAAAELRGRIRRELERAARDPARDGAARERCAAAAAEVDLAAIQTIHAFAGTLLRSFPLQAGLPPGFAVWDEVESSLHFDERFRTWLYDELPRHPRVEVREATRRALALGLTFDYLRALAAELHGQADLLRPETSWPAPARADPLESAGRIGRALLELSDEAFLGHARDPEDRMARALQALRPAAERLVAARDRLVALAALAELKLPSSKSGQAGNWGRMADGGSALAHAREALDATRGEVATQIEEARTAALAAILGALGEFTLAYARERRTRGAATFHDLLTWARDLLRDDPAARAEARARFSHVFVDEFQDTDPLQAEIVWYLTAAADGAPGTPWDALVPAPGKLFVVGDPKQSIYRFRRADLGVYDRVFRSFADDERLSLRVNFRSLPPVLRWANHHFATRFAAQPGVQPPYVPLEPSVGEGADGQGVHAVGGPVDGKADDVWSAEAAAVASVARRAVAEGWPVRDPDGTVRPARYRDVCALLPTRTNVRRLERAMRAQGVPYQVESGSLILATQEVREIVACLRAVDDPSDQVALVAALRSPAYACSDVDLLGWIELEGKLDYTAGPPTGADAGAGSRRVAEGLRSLAALHAQRADRSAAATIDALVRERMLAVQAFGYERPREAWRRIRYVAARARVLAAAGRPSLRALVDWLEDLQRAEFRDIEEIERLEVRHPDGATPDPDDDAVRFMTVHGAKGLEFPIVLLTGLGAPRQWRAPSVIVDRRSRSIEVRVGTQAAGYFKTLGYAAAEAAEKELDAAERVRLLYVATTRARSPGPLPVPGQAGVPRVRDRGAAGRLRPTAAPGALARRGRAAAVEPADRAPSPPSRRRSTGPKRTNGPRRARPRSHGSGPLGLCPRLGWRVPRSRTSGGRFMSSTPRRRRTPRPRPTRSSPRSHEPRAAGRPSDAPRGLRWKGSTYARRPGGRPWSQPSRGSTGSTRTRSDRSSTRSSPASRSAGLRRRGDYGSTCRSARVSTACCSRGESICCTRRTTAGSRWSTSRPTRPTARRRATARRSAGCAAAPARWRSNGRPG
jgi:ATP-dependent helicase/nuclease subunit A